MRRARRAVVDAQAEAVWALMASVAEGGVVEAVKTLVVIGTAVRRLLAVVGFGSDITWEVMWSPVVNEWNRRRRFLGDEHLVGGGQRCRFDIPMCGSDAVICG